MPNDIKPILFGPEEGASFMQKNQDCTFIDAFPAQIKELFIIDHPYTAKDKGAIADSPDFQHYSAENSSDFVYVHYPWSKCVVKCVPEEKYFRLITNRNQDLITAEEQRILYDYKVGVFGLSVGSNIAFTLSQSGISREMTIADYDTLDTTNLNRIWAGVHQIGLHKTTVVARKLYEGNPFLSLHMEQKKMDTDVLEGMLQRKQLDCIVDEVDDMHFKIIFRRLAMQYGIPVVMVTDNGDGVVLHVERYDLGWNKIFGKSNDEIGTIENMQGKENVGRFIMETIVGGVEKVDPNMLKSVKRVLAHELVSWSQLGSAALLGGVVATYAIKSIALGKNTDTDVRAHITPTHVEWGSHTDS